MAQTPVYAVVTGQIRDTLEFNVIITRLLSWRSEGLIDHIILSTWKEELDDKPSLRAELKKIGVTTIASEPIDLPPMDAYFMQQHATLFNGLSLCSDNSNVFRIRADRDTPFMKQFESVLKAREIPPTTPFGSFLNVFAGKIYVMPAWLSMPFLCHDNIVYGSRHDLEKICHFDVRLPSLCRSGLFGGEAISYANSFVRNYRELLILFRDFNLYLLSKALVASADMLGDKFVLPQFFNEVFAIYFTALFTQFSLIPYRTSDSDFNINFHELFSGVNDKKKPIEYSVDRSLGLAMSDFHIAQIMTGKLNPTQGYDKFLQTVALLKDQGRAFGKSLDNSRFQLSSESEEEIIEFLEKVNLPNAYVPRVVINPRSPDYPKDLSLLKSNDLWGDMERLDPHSVRNKELWEKSIKNIGGLHEILINIGAELTCSSDPSEDETGMAYYEEAWIREAPDFVYQMVELRKQKKK